MLSWVQARSTISTASAKMRRLISSSLTIRSSSMAAEPTPLPIREGSLLVAEGDLVALVPRCWPMTLVQRD